MARLGRALVVIVAVAGIALLGSAVQGLAQLDARLDAASASKQERTRAVKQPLRQRDCPRVESRES